VFLEILPILIRRLESLIRGDDAARGLGRAGSEPVAMFISSNVSFSPLPTVVGPPYAAWQVAQFARQCTRC
jgi:hypothetical protein